MSLVCMSIQALHGLINAGTLPQISTVRTLPAPDLSNRLPHQLHP